MLVADFSIPKIKPKFIVEASHFPNIRGIKNLAWKGFRLRKYRPDLISVCVINEVRCRGIKHGKGLSILNEAFDYVIDGNNYSKLLDVLGKGNG